MSIFTLHCKAKEEAGQLVMLAVNRVFYPESIQNHDSLNYPPSDNYLMAKSAKFKIKIVEEDTRGFDDFQYEVHVNSIDPITKQEIEEIISKLLVFVDKIGVRESYSSEQTIRREYWLDNLLHLQSSVKTITH